MADIELNCLVHGAIPAAKRVFPVVIARSRTVGTLKNLIKQKIQPKKYPEFADLAADKLTLWNVSISLDNNANKTLKQLSCSEIIKSYSRQSGCQAISLKNLLKSMFMSSSSRLLVTKCNTFDLIS